MDVIGPAVDQYVPAFEIAEKNVLNMFANVTLLNMLLAAVWKNNRPFPKTKETFKKEYDYVIVGGGTAGSVMANRLSQKPCVRVLLIEAGSTAPPLTEIPYYSRIFYGTYIDWLYKTTPQKYACFAQNERQVIWNSGKVLGGSSVLNAMLYVRGNKKNFDDWEKEGCTGWGYKDVLPYFKLLEDNKNIDELDPGYHHVGGPMTVEKPKYTSEIKPPILKAAKRLGYEIRDINGERQTGFYDLQCTTRNGQRCSTAKAYLVPAEDRPNLDILKDAFARKILIKDKKAYGVEFDFKDETHTVLARKEVIISSGSVRTPQILMLSGIGPKKHLKKFNIPLVADLPVGKNLQDHYTSYVHFRVNNTISPPWIRGVAPSNVFKYAVSREGPLTCPNQVVLMAFLDGLDTTSTSPDFPRQELYFAEYDPIDIKQRYNIKPEIYDKVYARYEGKPSWTCIASILQPYSRGCIRLNSTNPYDHPLINPNYFKDKRDLEDVVEAMKICQKIGTSKEMEEVQSRPYDASYPACTKLVHDQDKYFACQATQLVTTFWHPVGTARMGQPDDRRSVVDPELRVIGIEGLRVVNAAIMPIILSANTNIPTMMIAEKIYDKMKDDIMCPENCEDTPEEDKLPSIEADEI